MKFKKILLPALLLVALAACRNDKSVFVIETSCGDITVRLYDDTPVHKRNFAKLAGDGFYENLLFHNVQKGGLAEGGNSASRGVRPNRAIGENALHYSLPAEITPEHFHKRGALGARPDASSEFYIVLGTRHSPDDISAVERSRRQRQEGIVMEKLFLQNKDTLARMAKNADTLAILRFQDQMLARAKAEIDARPLRIFTGEQKKVYETLGGLPGLDGQNTVFGEVIDGFDVLDKIESAQTQPDGRPLENIVFKVK